MGLCLPPHGAVSLCLGPGSGGLRGFGIRHHQGHNVYLVVTKAALLFYKVTFILSISSDHLRGVKRGTCQLDLEVWPIPVTSLALVLALVQCGQQ